MDGFVYGIIMPNFNEYEGVMFYEREYKYLLYEYKLY